MSRRLHVTAALVYFFSALAYGADSSSLPSVAGATLTGVLATGETKVWRFDPQSGFYVRISASAADATLSLRLRSSANKVIQELASVGGTGGTALLAWLTDQDDSYKVELTERGSYPPQTNYRITLDEYRPTKADEKPQEIPLLQAADYISRGRTAIGSKRYRESLPLFEQALDIGRQLPDSRVESQALYGLGMVHYYTGEYPAALEFLQQALAKQRADNQLYEIALTLNNIAAVQQLLGACREATERFTEALELREKVHDKRGQGYTLFGLANAAYCMGDTQRALDSDRNASAIWRELKDAQNEANTLNTLGVIYLQMGDWDNSRQALESALALWRKTGNQLGEGNSTFNLALLESDTKHASASFESLQKAAELFRSVEDQRGTAYVLEAMGEAYGAQGLYSKALETLKQSRTLLEKTGDRYELGYLWDELGIVDAALKQIAEARNAFDKALELENQSGDSAGRAVTLFHLARLEMQLGDGGEAMADVDEAITAVEQTRKQVLDPAHRALYLATKREMYALKVRLLIDSGDTAKAFEASDAAHSRSLLDEVSQTDIQGNSNAAGRTAIAKVSDLQAHLDRDSVLLEYLVRNDASYAWAITDDGILSFKLPARTEIEPLCRQLSEAITARNEHVANEDLQTRTRRIIAARESAAHVENRLNALLLAPLPSEFRKRQIIIVPDGPLYQVPFPVLPLARRARLMETPSASVFLAGASNEIRPSFRPALVITDPQAETLPALEYANDEAAALKRALNGSDVDVLSKASATSAIFKSKDLSQFGLIHIAAHAALDPNHPDRSGIVLSDGRFTAAAIRKLSLHSRLVTLSACETARGKEIEGEGAMSLSRAFLYAGAGTVLSTLWPVDDQATAAFMDYFYKAVLERHVSMSEALLDARRQMQSMRGWSDPFYWGAFTLYVERP